MAGPSSFGPKCAKFFPSPQRKHIYPNTAFTGLAANLPMSTFFRTLTCSSVSITKLQRECALNSERLQTKIADLHPLVQKALQADHERMRQSSSRGVLPKFSEGDFVLVAREDFAAGEKSDFRWRGPRPVVKALRSYVFQVAYLRNGIAEEAHGSRLQFYPDCSLNQDANMSHFIASETAMPVQRLLSSVETDEGLKV